MTDVTFQVGKTYCNRIGEYEVLAIHPSSGRMDVRFLEGGVQKSLDLTIQARIINNMLFDAKREEAVALEQVALASRPVPVKAAAKKAAPKKAVAKKSAPKKDTADVE